MNTAVPQSVSRFDRIDDDTTSEEQPFWLYDPDGEPVVLSPSCVGFQVRYWLPNQRGLGTIVVDARNGRPLILPRTVTPDEFAERVGYKVGRYRLFLLDGSHRRLNVDPAQIEITPEMAAARRGELASTEVASSPASSSSSEPSAELLGHVFSFVEKANAQALAQIAGVQRELAERLGQVVDAMAGVLRAAGDSGVVQKSTALAAAAAGAPVIVQQAAPVNGNAPASPAAAPSSSAALRNAAGATAATATATAAADKGGVADALMALGMPLIEKLAPVAAYGMAQKMDVPEEVARDLAGFVKTATQTAGAMLKGDESSPASEASAVEAPAARTGGELMAHVLNIQTALPDDDRAWVLGQMAKRRDLVDALKPAVASISVEDGVRAVASLRAMDAALTTAAERACFDRLLQPDLLPTAFHNLFVELSPETAIAAVRAQAQQVERAQSAGA